MQTAILAGGVGTRLRPLTYKIPKPMVPVRGKPFLEHQIEFVKSQGFADILILASYLGEQIEEYFGDGSSLGIKMAYSYEESPMGTGGALKIADRLLKESFLLLNGDTLLPIDYRDLCGRYAAGGRSGMIVAYGNEEKVAPSNLKIGSGDEVLEYNKINAEGMTHLDAGAIVLEKKGVDMIPAGKICSLEQEIFPRLIEGGELLAFRTARRFYDMGSFEGLKNIEQVL